MKTIKFTRPELAFIKDLCVDIVDAATFHCNEKTAAMFSHLQGIIEKREHTRGVDVEIDLQQEEIDHVIEWYDDLMRMWNEDLAVMEGILTDFPVDDKIDEDFVTLTGDEKKKMLERKATFKSIIEKMKA